MFFVPMSLKTSVSDWLIYKQQRNRVNNLVRNNRARYKKELLHENADSSEKFWSALKKVYTTKTKSLSSTPVLDANGQKSTDGIKMANMFANQFATIAKIVKRKSILLKNFIWMPQDNTTPSLCNSFLFNKVNAIAVYNQRKHKLSD